MNGTLAELFVRIGADTKGLTTGLTQARGAFSGVTQSIRGIGNGVKGAVASLGQLGFAIFGIQQVARLASSAVSGLFGMNSAFEQYQVQFETLLGSVGAAKKRLAELAEFGRATPFELPQVVDASRVLQVFGDSALATGDSLRLVGDIAAGVGRPMEEVALWFGRAYDAMQSGRPAGLALRRLQEMGAVSGNLRNKLEELAKSGKGLEAWETMSQNLADTWGGNMDKLSRTALGAWSNIVDGFNLAKRALMDGVFQGIKPSLIELADYLGSEEFQGRASEWGVRLAEVTTPLIARLRNELPRAINALSVAWTKAYPHVMTFVSGLQGIWAAARQAFTFIINNKPVLVASLVAIGVAFGLALGGIPTITAAVIMAIGILRDNWREMGNAVIGITERLANGIIDGMNHIITGITNAIEFGINPLLALGDKFGVGPGKVDFGSEFIGHVAIPRIKELTKTASDFGREISDQDAFAKWGHEAEDTTEKVRETFDVAADGAGNAADAAEKLAKAMADARDEMRNIARGAVSDLGGMLEQALDRQAQAALDRTKASVEARRVIEESASKRRLEMLEAEQKQALRLLDEQTRAQVAAIQSQIDALDEKDLADQFAEIDRKLKVAFDPEERYQLLRQRARLERDVQRDALQGQISVVQEAASVEKNAITERFAARRKAEDEALANTLDALNAEQDAAQDAYRAATESFAIASKVREMLIGGEIANMKGLLNEFVPEWRIKGLSYGEQMIDGIRASGLPEYIAGVLGQVGTTNRVAPGGTLTGRSASSIQYDIANLTAQGAPSFVIDQLRAQLNAASPVVNVNVQVGNEAIDQHIKTQVETIYTEDALMYGADRK